MAVFDIKIIRGALIIASSYAQKAGQVHALTFKVKNSYIPDTFRLLITWSQQPADPKRDCLQGFLIDHNIFDESDDWAENADLSLLFHPLATDEMKMACCQHLHVRTPPVSEQKRRSTFCASHKLFNMT